MSDAARDFVQLAKVALGGKRRDIVAATRRGLLSIIKSRPDLAETAHLLLNHLSGDIVRTATSLDEPLPIDIESKLELVRSEFITELPYDPQWPASVAEELSSIVHERDRERELLAAGLAPTKTFLFVGPPGVGKTLAARWLALNLDRRLLTLDLAAVMSSYLGRTGNNIRAVLDFARSSPSVLLLDEFDAIAKRRDDVAEVGELKRLVTVLLQAVDEWPASGVLIAATNHHELLDPAVWRRFDRVVLFPTPAASDIESLLHRLLPEKANVDPQTVRLLASSLYGRSFADVVRIAQAARRRAILHGVAVDDAIIESVGALVRELDQKRRVELAVELHRQGQSQHRVQRLTGVSRDTLRRRQSTSVETVDGPTE